MPRFFGRSHAGDRTIRNRRPASVASRVTARAPPRARPGRCAAAWRLPRSPGTSPYSAKQTASSTLVLPAPVGPESRNSPAAESSSRSTSTWPANGPEGGDREVVEPHQAPGPGHERRRSPGPRSRRRRRRAAGRPPRRWPAAPRISATKSRAMSWSLRPCSRAAGDRGRLAGGRLEAEHQGVREAGPEPVHRLAAAGRRRSAWPGPTTPSWAARAGSASSSSRVPRRRASGRGTGASTNSAATDAVAARGRPATSPCGGWPRRRSRPAGSRCSAPSRSGCAARAGGPARRSRRRRRPTSARWRRRRR